jgi:hypothetical protein
MHGGTQCILTEYEEHGRHGGTEVRVTNGAQGKCPGEDGVSGISQRLHSNSEYTSSVISESTQKAMHREM